MNTIILSPFREAHPEASLAFSPAHDRSHPWSSFDTAHDFLVPNPRPDLLTSPSPERALNALDTP